MGKYLASWDEKLVEGQGQEVEIFFMFLAPKKFLKVSAAGAAASSNC